MTHKDKYVPISKQRPLLLDFTCYSFFKVICFSLKMKIIHAEIWERVAGVPLTSVVVGLNVDISVTSVILDVAKAKGQAVLLVIYAAMGIVTALAESARLGQMEVMSMSM